MKKAKITAVILTLASAAIITWRVTRGDDFLHAGTIEATEVDISSRISSIISDFKAREGDEAAQGQLLIRLDCEDLRLAADLAGRDFERAQRLLNTGAMSPENYDRLKNRRDETALKAGWCAVTSPIKGRVITTYHETGEWVSAGTKLLTLADLSEVYAWIYVEQKMLAGLSVGMKARGFLPEAGMKSFEGRITRISDEAEFTPKNVQTREERARLVYGVKVTFPNTEGILKPGMPIEVKLPG